MSKKPQPLDQHEPPEEDGAYDACFEMSNLTPSWPWRRLLSFFYSNICDDRLSGKLVNNRVLEFLEQQLIKVPLTPPQKKPIDMFYGLLR